ncbi:MAG: hypothetical protein K5894_02985 [Lachnospiraceae bacterium]|nr:hypothetical protein [Lachnospiraceae bacterium]
MFLFDMEDIWELGGSYKATKVIKKKHGLVYTDGLLKVGRGFDREISARAVFDSEGNGGILNIEKNSDFKEACKYFDEHAADNLVIMDNMRSRMHARSRRFVLRTYAAAVVFFLILALLCQFVFIGAGVVPAVMFSTLKTFGAIILVVSSVFLIREGLKLFSLNQYYL